MQATDSGRYVCYAGVATQELSVKWLIALAVLISPLRVSEVSHKVGSARLSEIVGEAPKVVLRGSY
jgi:hypothetical protein